MLHPHPHLFRHCTELFSCRISSSAFLSAMSRCLCRYIDIIDIRYIQGSVDMCRYPAVPVLQLQPLRQRDAVRLEGKREGGELGLYVLVRQILGTENIAFLFHGLKVVLCFTINTRIGGFLPAVSKITGDLKTFYTIKCVSFHTWAWD